jgi:hypothetical protein
MAQQPVVGQDFKTNYKFHIRIEKFGMFTRFAREPAKWFILFNMWRTQRVGLGETF